MCVYYVHINLQTTKEIKIMTTLSKATFKAPKKATTLRKQLVVYPNEHQQALSLALATGLSAADIIQRLFENADISLFQDELS